MAIEESLELSLLEAGDELAIHDQRRRAGDPDFGDERGIGFDPGVPLGALSEHRRGLPGIGRSERRLLVA